MRTTQTLIASAILAIVLSGCSGMSTRDRDTVIGAGVGAAAGSLLTEGSAAGTIGGGVIGGAIGNQIGKGKR